MRLRFILLFVFFTLLFLFYPGDSYYFHIFAYNRQMFNAKEPQFPPFHIDPIPHLISQYYPSVTAEGVYVVDLPSFTPIMMRNENERLYPASTTKIITALVAYDVFKPDQIITIHQVKNEGQVMGLVPGERITVENLFYGMLIYSGNDAAYALADAYGYDKFIALMNKKAESLHMTDSHFTNPAGLDNSGQQVTPFDLALAARALLQNKYLSRIVSIKEITISDVDFKIFHTLTNVNQLLGEIQGIGGLKTGYTENAGENLVSFYIHQGRQYIIVILKSQDRFTDTKNVVNWIDSNVSYITVPDMRR